MAWLDMQWNHPTRSDYLLMRVAQAIYQIPALLFGKKGDAEKVKLEDMRLKFEERYDKPKPEVTKEQYSAMARARWFGLLGMAGKPVQKEDSPKSMHG